MTWDCTILGASECHAKDGLAVPMRALKSFLTYAEIDLFRIALTVLEERASPKRRRWPQWIALPRGR